MILTSTLCCHDYYCNEHKMITDEISQVSKACKNIKYGTVVCQQNSVIESQFLSGCRQESRTQAIVNSRGN